MNYELAKKLKDAGFPFHWSEWSEESVYRNDPTLSELIEACGDNLYELVFVNFSITKWECYSKKVLGIITKGFTPEEAVSHLWLALNKE